jgi:hypothetical protein
LEAYPFPGIETGLGLLRRNVERIPNHPVLGTRVGDDYEWMTWKQAHDISEAFSYAVQAEGLTPVVNDGNKYWKFMGI